MYLSLLFTRSYHVEQLEYNWVVSVTLLDNSPKTYTTLVISVALAGRVFAVASRQL